MELLSLRRQGSWWVRAHPAVTTPAVPGDPAAPSRGRGAPPPQPRSRDETCSSQRRLAGRETAPKPTAPAALRPGGASCHPGQLRKLGAVGKRGRSPGSALPTGCQAVTPPRLLATHEHPSLRLCAKLLSPWVNLTEGSMFRGAGGRFGLGSGVQQVKSVTPTMK